MSSNLNIAPGTDLSAPTPQNTPLNQAPISLGLSRPTVPDISEDNEDDGEGKLAELVGRPSGYIENLPVEVKLNIEGLIGLQAKQNELQNQYKLECLELEKKYLGLSQPLYERRKAIIDGTKPATKEEVEAGEQISLKEDDEYEALPKDAEASSSGIPEFWLTALRNHIVIGEQITDRDADCLKHLTDIRIEYLNDENGTEETKGKPGFKLLFHFSPNEYFEDEVLTKTYVYQNEVSFTGDFVYDRAIGTSIKWKEDKDLTTEFEIKKQRNKTTNRTRLVRKAKPTDSFFNFFSPPVPPTAEQIENGDFEEEQLEEIEDKLETDYQIGEDLKEKVIPHAIDYFTGKALEYEFDGDEDDYDEFDEDEDDDDQEGESDSDDDAPPARRAPAKKGGAGGKQVNPEECKQQ